jgi:carboxymethylenebutenolidase
MTARSQTISLRAAGDRTIAAWYGAPEPEFGPPPPALVVLHDWWGFTSHVIALAERSVAAGFRVIAPDLLDGQVARAPLEGMRNAMDLDVDAAVGIVAEAVRTLGGPVGVLGFSLGGGVALIAAARGAGGAAVVSIYGLPRDRDGDGELTALAVPAQLHLAEREAFYSEARVEAVAAELTGRGHEVHRYAAAHGFFHDDQPATSDPVAAALAWSRAIGFLRRTLTPAGDPQRRDAAK